MSTATAEGIIKLQVERTFTTKNDKYYELDIIKLSPKQYEAEKAKGKHPTNRYEDDELPLRKAGELKWLSPILNHCNIVTEEVVVNPEAELEKFMDGKPRNAKTTADFGDTPKKAKAKTGRKAKTVSLTEGTDGDNGAGPEDTPNE